jgi:hypothetical protein
MAARRSRRRPNKWHGIAPFLAPGDVVEPHREGDRYGVTVRRDGQTWCTVLYSLGTAGEVTSVEFRPEVPPDVVLNIDPLVEVARAEAALHRAAEDGVSGLAEPTERMLQALDAAQPPQLRKRGHPIDYERLGRIELAEAALRMEGFDGRELEKTLLATVPDLYGRTPKALARFRRQIAQWADEWAGDGPVVSEYWQGVIARDDERAMIRINLPTEEDVRRFIPTGLVRVARTRRPGQWDVTVVRQQADSIRLL